mmetsp:Transcript_18395/g.61999  ORF Transcript_18395/g.61999 Transcript_18395/m.61999 type:complete len:227 (-) Transcript_18395:24-704(-)
MLIVSSTRGSAASHAGCETQAMRMIASQHRSWCVESVVAARARSMATSAAAKAPLFATVKSVFVAASATATSSSTRPRASASATQSRPARSATATSPSAENAASKHVSAAVRTPADGCRTPATRTWSTSPSSATWRAPAALAQHLRATSRAAMPKPRCRADSSSALATKTLRSGVVARNAEMYTSCLARSDVGRPLWKARMSASSGSASALIVPPPHAIIQGPAAA